MDKYMNMHIYTYIYKKIHAYEYTRFIQISSLVHFLRIISSSHQRHQGLSSEIFATANGFCEEGMTVLSAEAAVPFLGDLSRWGKHGMKGKTKGKLWESSRKTLGNMGNPL